MKINLNNKKVLFLVIILILMVILIFVYYNIFHLHRVNNLFAKDAEKYANQIEDPVFKIEKILTYSDANIKDFSEQNNLSKINVSQFTDFLIYINNRQKSSELTAENTINNIYIDNINVTLAEIGNQKVNFKSTKNLCKYQDITEGTNRIDYKVIHKNSEKNDESDYFFTDCSEPLTLTYVNENVVKNQDISNSEEKIALNGSILKYLNINLDDLKYKISFTVNIENNLNEKFKCDCTLDIDLTSDDGGIYTGYIMQLYDMKNLNYIFEKVNT